MTTATLTRTDGQIQADVIAELRWDSSVLGTEIGVAVKDGVVTLTGTVGIVLKKWRAALRQRPRHLLQNDGRPEGRQPSLSIKRSATWKPADRTMKSE
jgi:BON domain